MAIYIKNAAYGPKAVTVTDGLVLWLDAGNSGSYNPTTPPVELVKNGTFNTNVSEWITSNSSNDWVSSGKMKITRTGISSQTTYQVITTQPGVTYAVSADITAFGIGNTERSRGDLYVVNGSGWTGTQLFYDQVFAIGELLDLNLSGIGTFTGISTTTTIGFGVSTIGSNPIYNSIDVDNVSVRTLTWNDLSGNGNNGTLTNGPTYDSADGGSIGFSSTSYAFIPHSSSLDFNTALTISIWFYSGIVPPLETFLYLKGRTDENDPYNPLIAVNGEYRWSSGRDVSLGNRSTYTPPAGYIQNNTWYNLTVSHTSGVIPNIYKNAILSTSHSITEGTADLELTPNSLPVGINADIPRGKISDFNGKIALIQAYNRVLTSTEVEQNFNAFRSRFGI